MCVCVCALLFARKNARTNICPKSCPPGVIFSSSAMRAKKELSSTLWLNNTVMLFQFALLAYGYLYDPHTVQLQLMKTSPTLLGCMVVADFLFRAGTVVWLFCNRWVGHRAIQGKGPDSIQDNGPEEAAGSTFHAPIEAVTSGMPSAIVLSIGQTHGYNGLSPHEELVGIKYRPLLIETLSPWEPCALVFICNTCEEFLELPPVEAITRWEPSALVLNCKFPPPWCPCPIAQNIIPDDSAEPGLKHSMIPFN